MADEESAHTPDVPMRRLTREAFEAELVAVRTGANAMLLDSLVRDLASDDRPSIEGDHRAVWHAAEIALAILHPGYVPKREAVQDVRDMLAWYDDESDDWLRRD